MLFASTSGGRAGDGVSVILMGLYVLVSLLMLVLSSASSCGVKQPMLW